MKKLKRAKFIETGCWPVYVGFCDTPKAWKRLMKHLNCSDYTEFAACGNCSSFENSDGDLTIIISLNYDRLHKVDRIHKYETLAHEASHACDVIVEHIGDKEASTEMRAYIIGWLVREGARVLKL